MNHNSLLHQAILDESEEQVAAANSDTPIAEVLTPEEAEAQRMLYSACRYLKETHGRNESELARRILTVAAKCVGTDQGVEFKTNYLREGSDFNVQRRLVQQKEEQGTEG